MFFSGGESGVSSDIESSYPSISGTPFHLERETQTSPIGLRSVCTDIIQSAWYGIADRPHMLQAGFRGLQSTVQFDTAENREVIKVFVTNVKDTILSSLNTVNTTVQTTRTNMTDSLCNLVVGVASQVGELFRPQAACSTTLMEDPEQMAGTLSEENIQPMANPTNSEQGMHSSNSSEWTDSSQMQ